MTEHPILFSGAMVRALLAGTKTQTRRVVKWRNLAPGLNLGFSGLRAVKSIGGYSLESDTRTSVEDRCAVTPSPYGQPGDRLWVRETHYDWGHWTKRFHTKMGRKEWHFVDETLGAGMQYRYEASEKLPRRKRELHEVAWWKRPAIFMPRAASRITLEVTEVRVERLQDISEVDAIAEGIEPFTDFLPSGHWRRYDKATFNSYVSSPVDSYASLWESINGPGSWDANPWVWAVSLKVVKGGGV